MSSVIPFIRAAAWDSRYARAIARARCRAAACPLAELRGLGGANHLAQKLVVRLGEEKEENRYHFKFVAIRKSSPSAAPMTNVKPTNDVLLTVSQFPVALSSFSIP